MATVSDPDGDPPDVVEFVHEDDGRVTARHVESGVASFGDTEAEALRQLADALDSHFGDGESIDAPEAYLAEQGIDVEIGSDGPPPWLD
ncbi:hypothetical protein Halar_0030 (plasmid) [halophilic archaeon DL31]|nr:hypothetical protein Halar_0030 [halophilic archaeon DL31]